MLGRTGSRVAISTYGFIDRIDGPATAKIQVGVGPATTPFWFGGANPSCCVPCVGKKGTPTPKCWPKQRSKIAQLDRRALLEFQS